MQNAINYFIFIIGNRKHKFNKRKEQIEYIL